MDRESEMKDVHLHFTGSLSQDYVFQQLKDKNPNFLKQYSVQNGNDLGILFRNMFSDNYKINQQIFNTIYTLVQSVTKPSKGDNIRETYRVATHNLTMNLIRHGITDYTIISGPDIDINNTYERFLGMIMGFEDTEKTYKNSHGQISITFIRNDKGILKNYSIPLLQDICKLLCEEPFKSRCVGFDISGYEYPNEELLKSNLNTLSEIIEAKRSHNLQTTIGLHAGEIITDTSADFLYDDYFIKLSDLKIDNIGHGTYLWSKPRKQNILKMFAGKTRFDICPISNELLTPITNIQNHIENLQKCGIEYTFNRDDPLIFNNWQIHQR